MKYRGWCSFINFDWIIGHVSIIFFKSRCSSGRNGLRQVPTVLRAKQLKIDFSNPWDQWVRNWIRVWIVDGLHKDKTKKQEDCVASKHVVIPALVACNYAGKSNLGENAKKRFDTGSQVRNLNESYPSSRGIAWSLGVITTYMASRTMA